MLRVPEARNIEAHTRHRGQTHVTPVLKYLQCSLGFPVLFIPYPVLSFGIEVVLNNTAFMAQWPPSIEAFTWEVIIV